MSEYSKTINDAYYTPQELVRQFVNTVGNVEGLTIYDPCCGDGRLSNPFKAKNVVVQTDLPTDYLKFRLGSIVDIIVMNPPFTYDSEFISFAALEADVVWAILPLSWCGSDKLDTLNHHIHVDFVDYSYTKNFETPQGKKTVRTGIFKIHYDEAKCRVNPKRIYTKEALNSLGISFSNKKIDGHSPIIIRGSRVGEVISEEEAKLYTSSIIGWINLNGVCSPEDFYDEMRYLSHLRPAIQRVSIIEITKVLFNTLYLEHDFEIRQTPADVFDDISRLKSLRKQTKDERELKIIDGALQNCQRLIQRKITGRW